MLDYVIIGSGPTGISAAIRLVSLGKSVTLIDGGDQIDSFRMETVDSLSQFLSLDQSIH